MRELRALAWLGGRAIRWKTIQMMLDARYVDGYRMLHPTSAGFTFPIWDPHDGPVGVSGSDHFPLLAELEDAA